MARIASKKLNRKIGGDVFILVILILVGGFMLLPFIYAILQSFKPMEEIFLFPPRFFVNRPTTENFYQLTQLVANSWVPFTRYIFNSLLVSIIATAAHVIIASMAAYPLAKATFPGSPDVLPGGGAFPAVHHRGDGAAAVPRHVHPAHDRHLFRPDSAGHRLVPRAVLDEAVHLGAARQHDRGGEGGRRGHLPHLLEHRHAQRQAPPG